MTRGVRRGSMEMRRGSDVVQRGSIEVHRGSIVSEPAGKNSCSSMDKKSTHKVRVHKMDKICTGRPQLHGQICRGTAVTCTNRPQLRRKSLRGK